MKRAAITQALATFELKGFSEEVGWPCPVPVELQPMANATNMFPVRGSPRLRIYKHASPRRQMVQHVLLHLDAATMNAGAVHLESLDRTIMHSDVHKVGRYPNEETLRCRACCCLRKKELLVWSWRANLSTHCANDVP